MFLRESLRYRLQPRPDRQGPCDGFDMLGGSVGRSLIQVPCQIQMDHFYSTIINISFPSIIILMIEQLEFRALHCNEKINPEAHYLDNGAIHSGVPGKGAGDPLGVDILLHK